MIETVFGMNGLGRLAARSVRAQDVQVLQGIVLLPASALMFVDPLVDVLSALMDPRLRRPAEALA